MRPALVFCREAIRLGWGTHRIDRYFRDLVAGAGAWAGMPIGKEAQLAFEASPEWREYTDAMQGRNKTQVEAKEVSQLSLTRAASPVTDLGTAELSTARTNDYGVSRSALPMRPLNLTAQQRDLLFAIVDADLSGDGSPFIFVANVSEGALVYPRGRTVRVNATELDFRQLAEERLIALVFEPHLGGKPTQLGIDTVDSLRNPATTERPASRESVHTAVPTNSWADLGAEFLQYAEEHAGLQARWIWEYTKADQLAQSPPRGKWTLDGGLPSSQHLFREIARKAIGRLPNPSSGESWRLWLDLLRAEGYARKMVPKIVPWRQFKAAAASSKSPPLPQGFENEQIEDVFKSSATFCQVRAFAEAGPPLPQRATEDISGNSRVPRSVEQSSYKETAIGVTSSPEVPPLNPFAPSDPRYDAWAELALMGPGRLKSAADNVAGDNEQITGALTALLKALPPERDQLWKEVLPILRRRRPRADLPDIAPLDDNEIVGMFTPALADPETAVLNRFATQGGEALSRFVLCKKDIDAYIEMVG